VSNNEESSRRDMSSHDMYKNAGYRRLLIWSNLIPLQSSFDHRMRWTENCATRPTSVLNYRRSLRKKAILLLLPLCC